MQKSDLVVTRIQVEKEIKGNVSSEQIWQVLADFEHYPDMMDNVTSVRVFEQEGYWYSEWHVEVEDAPLTWTEKDVLDQANWQIRFEAVQGDLYLFRGDWQIDGHPPAHKICFRVEYSLGVPTLERALGHILKEKMEANIRQMLDALNGQVCHENR